MYKGFYLKGKKGNNAFSYEERKNVLGSDPKLWVPELREVKWGNFDGLLDGKVVFEDLDEHGVLQTCKGMKTFVRTEFNGVPLLLFDNHNHALYFFYEAFVKGQFKRGAKLVHVDQHKDMRPAEKALNIEDLEGEDVLKEVFRYTNEEVNVGNYIRPAIEEGLIDEVQLVTGEGALDEMPYLDSDNLILNIDLDYFAPELGYIDFKKAKSFILKHAERAKLITVASSPFFIEQGLAMDVFGELFGDKF